MGWGRVMEMLKDLGKDLGEVLGKESVREREKGLG